MLIFEGINKMQKKHNTRTADECFERRINYRLLQNQVSFWEFH
jgi:hypothetical protein